MAGTLSVHYRDIVGAKVAINSEAEAIDAVNFVKIVLPIGQARCQGLCQGHLGPGRPFKAFKSQIANGNSEIPVLKHAEKILEKAGANDDEEGGEGWTQSPTTAVVRPR